MVVFTDASLGNINEWTGSTGAFIIWVMDKTGNCCPIAWNAHNIKRVVRSTLAAEMLSLEEGLEASVYYRPIWRIFKKLNLNPYKLKSTLTIRA